MSDGTKILLFIIFTISAVSIPEENFNLYISHFLIILSAAFYFRSSFFYLLERMIIGLPFILIISASSFLSHRSHQVSLLISLSIAIKYLFVFVCGTIVFSDIRLHQGLKQLHVPATFISIITLMERFISIFKREIQRIFRAAETRSFRKRKFFKTTLAKNISNVMLIRGFERSRMIYNAMTVRGFDGDVRFIIKEKFRICDITILAAFTMLILCINLLF
ncbi:energy-coupling factor transporter transmembrane component T family protein [candidate division KSB1 bacterium]